MNIKISIKDCDCIPNITNGREISEVEHKKRTMLYAPPENDKNNRQTIKVPPTQKQQLIKKPNIDMNSQQYRRSQQQMLNQLKKNGQNQATVDMVHNSNLILQKQTQILQKNQKTIHEMVNNGKKVELSQSQKIKIKLQQALNQMNKQVAELGKMKTQILTTMQQFKKLQKNQNQNKQIGQNRQYPNHIAEMHTNMKNQIQSNLDGIGNMEAIKNLQSFNMEGYGQAINSLKRQIAQLQKQSQNIERQLKIRTAKLEKLELPPKFQEQLYKPYQQHLQDRVKAIDLYGIRQRLYEKIGMFDYGKFEGEINNIMAQVKNQLGNIPILEKQFKIIVPDIRIDQKQLKNLDMKLPSVLDEYKAVRGIRFDDFSKQNKGVVSNFQKQRQTTRGRLSKTNEIQERLKQTNSKKPPSIQRMTTKPVDLAHQVNLNKQYQKKPTILDSNDKIDKKQLNNRIKNAEKQIKKYQDEFDTYLQNRAQQELQLLRKQRDRKRIKQLANSQLEENKNKRQNEIDLNKKKKIQQKKKPEQQQEYEDEFEPQQKQQLDIKGQKKGGSKNINLNNKQIIQENQHVNIKQVGRQILKQKLKNLLGQKNKYTHNVPPINNINVQKQSNLDNGERQIQNIAQGFINMINNTLTQVNSNLSRSIQKKISQNQQKKPASLQKRQARTIKIPELQAFRPPPVFNMNFVQQPLPNPYIPPVPIAEPKQPKKIVVQNYDQFKIKNDDDYRDYQISSEDEDDI